ncbi:MAG: glycosyltransferase family 9 protein [Ignavibacteriaceae bacterium]|jgi:ADP-heptose:LPS heptosyltransferase|nr:glycosyltransferase family 9 protein [Ignavibacteriaceae bacterium]
MITPNNILLVRTDRIGDVVLSLPLAEAIKKEFPDCRVTFLVKAYTLDLVKNHPFIDEVLTLDETDNIPNIFSNVRKIGSKNFDSCIVVYPTFRIAFILFLTRIKNRIGTGYRSYSFFFTKKIYEHRKYAERHELQYNMNLLKVFGIEKQLELGEVDFHIQISEEGKKDVQQFFLENKIDTAKPLIIVHPGSGGSAVDLPLLKMKELVQKLLNLNVTVLITGSGNEKEICQSLVLNEKIINVAGRFSLSSLIALIEKSSIFISNSTGPLHIAAALKKYVVGFYPKIDACSVRRWGPFTEKKMIYEPAINCQNCTRKQCERLNCMETISIDEVFANIKNYYMLLQKNGDF